MSLHTEVQVQDVDNRDTTTTWLWINDTEYVEVNPVDLLENMLENLIPEDFTRKKYPDLDLSVLDDLHDLVNSYRPK